jgi:hypothetical protein
LAAGETVVVEDSTADKEAEGGGGGDLDNARFGAFVVDMILRV